MCSVNFPASEAPDNEFAEKFDVLTHEPEHDPQSQEGETPCATQ